MARQAALPLSLPPIGATLDVAAAFVSVSPAKFTDLVNRGLMPKPKRVDRRLIWDLEEVKVKFKALPSEADAADATWTDVDAA
jgi:hypothetical protein